MKRLVSFFLLFAYLLASPGLVYSMHFCGQSLMGVTLEQAGPRSCCCNIVRAPAGGCCHDQVVTSSVKDARLAPSQVQVSAPAVASAPALLPLVWRLSNFSWPLDAPATGFATHAAPPPECPAYVRGHAFLV